MKVAHEKLSYKNAMFVNFWCENLGGAESKSGVAVAPRPHPQSQLSYFIFAPPQIVTCSSASDNYIPFSRFGQTVDYSQQQTVTMQSVPYSDVQVPLSTDRQIPFKLQYRVTAVLTGTCQEPVLAGINLRLVATQCRPVLLISEKKKIEVSLSFYKYVW